MAEKGINLQPIDLSSIIFNGPLEEQQEVGKRVLQDLQTYGCVITKDPRVPFEKNLEFQQMIEKYFEQPFEKKEKDFRPQFHYQVGATPERVEKARSRCSEMEVLDLTHRPVTLCPPEHDLKWRYFWRIGERPKLSKYQDLNMKQVIPDGFDNWGTLCNKFGGSLLDATLAISQAVAIGYGLDKDFFVNKMKCAPHLLAPTGSDLNKYAKDKAIFAGYHTDLNFLTTHGKSNFPGLFIWLRDGSRHPVSMPDGCLLTQAGQQIEHMTGGNIYAGFHEVVFYDKTQKALERRKQEGKSLWRVSTTLFSHIASDEILEVIPQLQTEANVKKYVPMTSGDHVREQLRLIGLSNEQKEQQLANATKKQIVEQTA